LAVPHDEADPCLAGQAGELVDGAAVGGRPGRDGELVDAAGLVPQPDPSAHGSVSTGRIGTRSSRAAAGTRLPCTTTENMTATAMMPYRRCAPGTPASIRKLPSRIGTAPFSPANSTNPSSLGPSRAGPTTAGRMANASAAPRTSPGTHTSARLITSRLIVRPRTMKATISARLASAEWNRSISRL
jgi:hypothetical protein